MGKPSTITPSVPAVIFCAESTGKFQIAALTLLDRLIVTLHRAACAPITIVCDGPWPNLRRSAAWRISVNFVASAPICSGPTLVAEASVLVQPCDITALLHERGRLTASDGTPLPIGVVNGFSSDPSQALLALPSVRAQGVAFAVTDNDSARRAERALWQSLTSSSDGWVDRHFNRPVGRPLSKLLIHTPVSPNTVSIVSILIGLVAAGLFAIGNYAMSITAAVLFQISAIIDCVDGDIARAVFKESPLGKWLDLAGDQVVHVAVFAAIAIGLWRQNTETPELWLGISAVTGALLSFAVVLRGLKRMTEKSNNLLRRIIDSATNRDFSVLVFGLAVADILELFLWMTAVGTHLFWITLLFLQRGNARIARTTLPTAP